MWNSVQTSFSLPLHSTVTEFKRGQALSYKLESGKMTLIGYTTADNLYAGVFLNEDTTYDSLSDRIAVVGISGFPIILTDGSVSVANELEINATGLYVAYTSGTKVGRALSSPDGKNLIRAVLYSQPIGA